MSELQQVLVCLFNYPVSISRKIFRIRAIRITSFHLGRRNICSSGIQFQVNLIQLLGLFQNRLAQCRHINTRLRRLLPTSMQTQN